MEVRRDMSSLIFVIAFFGCAFGNKVITPSTNGVYQVGSQIVLPCSVDTLTGAVLSWLEYQTASTGTTICTVTADNDVQCDQKYTRYSIASNGTGTNSYNLVINNAALTDGGLYNCGFAKIGSTSASMTVVVYDRLAISVPQQSALNQQIPVSCSVTYQSVIYSQLLDNLRPVITLSAGNNKLATSTDAMVPDKTKKTIALSLNGTTLITNYNQLPMNVSCSIAINSPAMVNINYAPINVQYPTQKVMITIDPPSPDNKYTIGENSTVTVTCTADGFPTPTIVWSDQTTGTVPHLPTGDKGTSTIELDQDWTGSEHHLSCSANNNVGNSQPIYYNVTFTVGAAANVHVASANMGWIAAVVIVPIAVLVAIIVIVVVLRKKRNQAPKKTTAQPAQRPQDYNNQPYQPINQNPNFASPPPAAGYQPSPNNRHPMTRDSPGYGDLGVNRFAVPAGHPNLSASFDDNNSLNGRVPPQAPSSRAPDLPGNNRSPMMMQQPGMGMRQDPDTMV